MKCNMVRPDLSHTYPHPLTQSAGQLFPRRRKTHLIPLLRLLHRQPSHRTHSQRSLRLQIPPLPHLQRLFLLQHCLPFPPNILIFNIKHTLSTSTTSTTSSNPPAVTNNGGYKKNNCLRAVQGGDPSATGFCSDFFGTGILPTPTAINKACSALPAKVSSACSCAVPNSWWCEEEGR
jgi:hypothetical protein